MTVPLDGLLDKRLHAFRDDLADIRLKDQCHASRYVEGQPARIGAHFADILDRPETGAGLQTQILHGHDVSVFERADGWAWVQRESDGYVGYLREETLMEAADQAAHMATHMVSAPRTFIYRDADLKHPRSGYRSMGSKLTIVGSTETRGTSYALLEGGEAVIESHLIALGDWKPDPVSVAESLLNTPYLWGGDTGFGVDCSGLVFLSYMLCGITVPRDSDMQAAGLGTTLETDLNDLERGDLIFWKGHVGMMMDRENLLHANGHTMNVAIENLQDAIARIGYLYDLPTGARRP